MPKVMFKCTMADVAVVQLAIQNVDDKSDVGTLQFESSGQRGTDVSSGDHLVFYKGLGEEGGTFTIEVVSGGTLSASINRTLPEDGVASGLRQLHVG